MLLEQQLIPYTVSPPVGDRSLILAPHPDDETLGCGGTIRLLLEKNKQVKVIFLTSGDKADESHPAASNKHGREHITDYSIKREKEAVKALKVLGITDYMFMRFPDRAVHTYFQDVLNKLYLIMKEFSPDTIYSPSMIELNPDHRITAELVLELQRKVTNGDVYRLNISPIRIAFYEVTVPLRPNILVDITSTYSVKKRAIKKYKTQLKTYDYFRHTFALNTIRALTVQKARYVEAFWISENPPHDEDVLKWFAYQKAI
jgi:LmbE family N-acetylglucosaminyl deacetylase